MRSSIIVASAFVALSACRTAPPGQAPTPSKDTTAAGNGPGSTSLPNADPFPSTYVRTPAAPFVIRNVNVMTAAGPTIRNGAVAVVDGKIVAVGQTVDAPAGAVIIDGGRVVREREYERTATLTVELIFEADTVKAVYLLDEPAFESNLNQMFVLGRFDAARFDEVFNDFPYARAFRVLARPR